jgi:hypothetical protein
MHRRAAVQADSGKLDRATNGLFELQVTCDREDSNPVNAYPIRSRVEMDVAKLPQVVS